MTAFILYKNNKSHGTEPRGEEPLSRFWMFYKWNYKLEWLLKNSQMTLVKILSVSWGCVTESTVLQVRMCPVAKVLNLESPHLVNEIQTQLLWLKWMFYKYNYDLGCLLEDSQMTLVGILSISWGCVTESTVSQAWMCSVAEVLNLELPHLANGIQTQLLWLKPQNGWNFTITGYNPVT
jgi:hypothetical protein